MLMLLAFLAVSSESFTKAKRKVDPCNSLIKHCKTIFGASEDIGEKCCVKKNTTSIQNLIKHKLPPQTHMKTSHTSLKISIFIFLFVLG